MPHSEYFAKAAFVVMMTAVLDRQVWRYPYARAYRAALTEAGHVCQTFCLTATWLGLAPFCLMGLDDAAIEQDLGIDGVRETALYVAGAGPVHEEPCGRRDRPERFPRRRIRTSGPPDTASVRFACLRRYWKHERALLSGRCRCG